MKYICTHSGADLVEGAAVATQGRWPVAGSLAWRDHGQGPLPQRTELDLCR